MSGSTIAIRSADLGSADSVSAEIDDTAGRSDPMTGLVSATIALDERATGSSTVAGMLAIGATGPPGSVRPAVSCSNTASSLSSDDLLLTSNGSRRSAFKCCASWMVQSTKSISVMFASCTASFNQPQGQLLGQDRGRRRLYYH